MVELRIDVVDTNGVDLSAVNNDSSRETMSIERHHGRMLTYTQLLHHHSIAQTDIGI
jgi:hypothetical protein